MNSEDKPVNLSRCRDNSAQSSTCRSHLESHTSRSENSDTFLWWCLHVYRRQEKVVKNFMEFQSNLSLDYYWMENKFGVHTFFQRFAPGRPMSISSNLIDLFTISSHVIGSKKDHAISFRKWKIKPSYRHDLLTSVFPCFSPTVLASLIGSFERQLTPWLAEAITSVFPHGNPIENALRRFPINETAVELRYTLCQETGKIACMFQGYVISKKSCSIHLSTWLVWLTLTSFAFFIKVRVGLNNGVS